VRFEPDEDVALGVGLGFEIRKLSKATVPSGRVAAMASKAAGEMAMRITPSS
jgi:hypothetical protein